MGIKILGFLKSDKSREESPWFKKLLLFGFLFLTILTVGAFFNNFSRLKKAEEKIEEKKRRIEELRKENESIKNRLKEITSEAYIEKQLRDNLAMAKKGEVVVVLPDEDTIRSLVPKIDFGGDEAVSLTNWRKWLLFFNF